MTNPDHPDDQPGCVGYTSIAVVRDPEGRPAVLLQHCTHHDHPGAEHDPEADDDEWWLAMPADAAEALADALTHAARDARHLERADHAAQN